MQSKWISISGVILLLIAIIWTYEKNQPHKNIENPMQAYYISPNGEVTDTIVQLLGLTGIRIANDPIKPNEDWPEPKISLKSRALSEVVPVVQGKINPAINWFGNPKKERWEKDPSKSDITLSQAQMIRAICRNELHQKEQLLPTVDNPKAIMFLGAALMRVRLRLAFLNQLYDNKALSPKLPVYLLMGERKLDAAVGETQENLKNPDNGIVSFRSDWKDSSAIVDDEWGMIKLVFDQSRHKDLEASNIYYVQSPKEPGHRGTTQTNILQWLKEYKPESGNYIAISNQPYSFYQESSIRRVLLQAGRSDIIVQVIGPAMEGEPKTEAEIIHEAKNLLNNLSRILKELLEIQELKGA